MAVYAVERMDKGWKLNHRHPSHHERDRERQRETERKKQSERKGGKEREKSTVEKRGASRIVKKGGWELSGIAGAEQD